MGRRRNRKKTSRTRSIKRNSNTKNPNEEKPENTNDSRTPGQDDCEDNTQTLSLEETNGKSGSDHDMNPKKKEEKSMETLGENNGNDNDNHGGKKPSGKPRPQNKGTLDTDLSETKTPDENKASSDTPQNEGDDTEIYRRNNDPDVNARTQSNNYQSTSEEGKSSKAEMSTKSDDANEIETADTISATSNGVDPLPQRFETPEYKHDSIDTEEKQCKHNTMKREGKQVKHGHVDRMIESQSEHKQLNMGGDQQNGEDDNTEKRTSDLENNMTAMTQSNNDQRTPEEVIIDPSLEQPIQLERTTESNGVYGENTTSDVSPTQSFQTGHIKNDHVVGAEGRPQNDHVDGTEGQPQHYHVDGIEGQSQHDLVHGTEGQPQHDHVDGTEGQSPHGPVDGKGGQTQHYHMDGAEGQSQHDHVDGTEERPQHDHVDGIEGQSPHGLVDGTEGQPQHDHVHGEEGQSKHDLVHGTEGQPQHDHVDGREGQSPHGPVDGTEGQPQHYHMDGAEWQSHHDHMDGREGQSPHDLVDGIEGQPQHGHVQGAEGQPQHELVDMEVGQHNEKVDNDSTSTGADINEDGTVSPQSSDNGADEIPSTNASLNQRNQSRRFSEEDTSTESNDLVTGDEVREETTVASNEKSEDDSPSQSVQNENIDPDNIDIENMQRSASITTNSSPDTSITFENRQPSGAYGDDVIDDVLRNGKMCLNENETENNNVVIADNFKDETDSLQSPDFGTDMAQYQGSVENHSYNSLSDLQIKTSQEQVVEKLQRELNIKRENLVTLQKEIKRRDEIIEERASENADLLHRCVTSETSAEAADNLRKQCEYKNHQIETLEGDLASTRDENENLKRHLEETEKVAADHQRLIDENKSLSESLEQGKQASAKLKEEVQALKEHITNHENAVNDLERQIKMAIEDKEKLEAKLVSRNENNSSLLSNYLEMEKKGEEMAAGLQKMQQTYQDEARRLEELSVQFRLKQVELTTAENKYKEEIEEMKAKYKTEKDQAEKHKELQQNQIIRLAGESQHLQAENKRLKADLQTKSMECGDLKSERLRITKDLDATKKEMSELNNVNDKLRADITAVNAEIMQLKAALEFKEAEKKFANECMQKAVREQQEMMYSIGNLQRIQLENEQLKTQSRYLLEQNTKLQASLEEYGLLRDHIQEYYKAFQDSQMEIQREKEKNRHINELLSKTGYRLDSMASELQNHRTTADSYRRSLEEKNETFHKLERELDRRTIDNKKLKEERDKCEQECFVYRDECRSLREYLEKSQAEFRELLSRTQKGASDGTTGLLRGQQQTRIYQTSTPIGKGFQNLGLHTSFSFDKMNRKK